MKENDRMIRKAVGAIVFQKNRFLLVHKVKINALENKEEIHGEWDFVKGGAEDTDTDFQRAVLRELFEETGSTDFRIVKELPERIVFDFPEEISKKIGYKQQETTMFLVEFLGESDLLRPIDNEISEIRLVDKDKVVEMLTHPDTITYFQEMI